MLNRSKVAQELRRISDKLFVDCSVEYNMACDIWKKITDDPTISHRIREIENLPWPVPTWDGKLSEIFTIPDHTDSYHVLSVDGSQIYPDRHQGPSCFLINLGTVSLHYGCKKQPVYFDSEPYIFTAQEDTTFRFSTDLVNCRRQELELNAGLQEIKKIQNEASKADPPVLLFDGSLIFWLLEGKDGNLKNHFLGQYLASLHKLYQEKTVVAGYISQPKSKELVNIIRLALCDFNINLLEAAPNIDHIIDTTIARFFLKPFQRSIIFQNNANISTLYPDHIRPSFFYLHVGTEIGRVEIPAWIAQDEKKVNYIAQIIIDQCTKGNGYPIALAEAHEQAVVKGPDRDFFYHLLTKISMEHKQRMIISPKSMRKRRMGI